MRWRCDQRRKVEDEKEGTPPLFFHLARAKPYSASGEGEGEGLGGEPEVRGGSGVEGARPQHPGIAFFFFFFFLSSPTAPAKCQQEAEVKNACVRIPAAT